MRRRAFIGLLGGVSATWSLAARAQQPAMPAMGFISLRSAAETKELMAAFREGLSEAGYVEGRNLAIEFRWADGRYDRLAALAGDLVARQVAVIATGGGASVAIAVKAATSSIPIVFSGGSDPVAAGLVASLSRPGGNATGVVNIAAELTAKRFELLTELAPDAAMIAALRNPGHNESQMQANEIEAAARKIGKQVHIAAARTEQDFESALTASLQRGARALFVANDAFLQAVATD